MEVLTTLDKRTDLEALLLPRAASIDVLVPAYNEEKNVVRTLKRISGTLGRVADEFRLVVVDDGSKDGTAEKILNFSQTSEGKMITLVRNGHNSGKGAAIQLASEYVKGDVVALVDADFEIDPEQLQLYIDSLRFADMCIASKRHPNSVYEAKAWRKVVGIGFNKLVRLMTGLEESDTQAGLKVIRGEYFRDLIAPVMVKRYAFDVEMLLIAKLLHMRVVQLPVRVDQDSGFRVVDMAHMLWDLLAIAFRLRVTRWYQRALAQDRQRT